MLVWPSRIYWIQEVGLLREMLSSLTGFTSWGVGLILCETSLYFFFFGLAVFSGGWNPSDPISFGWRVVLFFPAVILQLEFEGSARAEVLWTVLLHWEVGLVRLNLARLEACHCQRGHGEVFDFTFGGCFALKFPPKPFWLVFWAFSSWISQRKPNSTEFGKPFKRGWA